MKDFSSIIGNNLHKIRKQRNLSLDKAAELTGVSKAMLSQIEKGTSNPTVATLWKIASGLRVSFSYFMEEAESIFQFVSTKELKPIVEEEGKLSVYPLFSYDESRKFEVFTIELKPGCRHHSAPHNEGVEEYVIVTEGALQLEMGQKCLQMVKGDAVRYPADIEHSYSNLSEENMVFQQIIFYRV